jgi:hypothetical protein
LQDDRALGNMFAVCDIAHPELDQVTRPEPAVDGEVELSKGANVARELNANPNGPDVPKSERCFLSDEFAFVPRLAAPCGCLDYVHGGLLP